VTRLLLDTSVLIKWLHGDGENEVHQARAIRAAHTRGEVEARIIDLALYELGNVLLRSLRWPSEMVADQLDDILTVCGAPISMTPDWLRQATSLAGTHGLTFYDASWAAAANALKVPLVTADRRLLGAGLAESPTAIARRLRLLG